jgi:DHA1 family bicyclomycin/chloramphenicol resistance-like MFS transporter
MTRNLAPGTLPFKLLLGLVTSMQATGSTILMPALPAIAAYFSVGSATAQLTVSVFILGVASGQLFWGVLADRFGRRPVMLWGLGLFVLAGLGSLIGDSVESLVACRALQGFGGASGMIVGRAMVRDLFAADRAVKMMSFIGSVIATMPVVAPLIGGILLTLLSWRGTLGLLVLAAIATWIAAFRYMGESIRARDPDATNLRRLASNIWRVFRTPQCLLFTLTMVLIYGGMFGVMTMLPYVVITAYGVPDVQAALFIGLLAIASFTGTRISSVTAGRFRAATMLWFSTGLALASGLGLLAASTTGRTGAVDLVLLMTPVMAYGIAFGITQSNCIVLAMQPVPDIAGVASAVTGSVQMASAASFASLAGAVFDGSPSTLGICGALGGVAGFLAFALGARHYAQPAAKRSPQ